MDDLPRFENVTKELDPDFDTSVLRMNWRSTMPWKLECEEKGQGRDVGYQQFSFRLLPIIEPTAYQVDRLVFHTLVLIGAWRISTFFFGNIGVWWPHDPNMGFYVGVFFYWIERFTVAVMSHKMISYLETVEGITKQNLQMLEDFNFADCSDA